MLSLVEILDIKYLNNIVEQSHRWVKQKTRQALGWKSVEGAMASLHGREMWTILKRAQIDVAGDTSYRAYSDSLNITSTLSLIKISAS